MNEQQNENNAASGRSDAKALLGCPLCGEPSPNDKGFGIECRNCGLWLGDGARSKDLGGYRKAWNTRAI